MELSVLLNKMLIFVALMFIGYILAKRGVLGPQFTKAANKLVLDVFMVGTILSSMISTAAEGDVNNLGEIILLTAAAQVVGYLVAAVAARLVHPGPDREAPFELLMAVPNTMFIALPIAEALYGSYAVLILSVSCIAFNVLIYSYGVWRLKGGRGGRLRLRETVSVPMVATLIGILLLVTKIPVPAAVQGLLVSLGGATMPMSMMVIGASLGSVSLLDAFRNPWLAMSSLVRLLVVPVLAWLVCGLLTDDTALRMCCMIIAAAPSGVLVSILAIQYGKDGIFSSEGVQHSTVCSMATIPLLITVLSRFC